MKPVEDILRTIPLDDPYSRLHVNLMYTGRWLQERFNAVLAPHGLNEAQFNVLRILRGQRGTAVSEAEVAKRMVHAVEDVASLIGSLERSGLVERVATGGLTPTVEGLQLLQRLDAVVETQRHDVFSALKPEEAVWVGQLLDRIRGDQR